MEGISLKNKCQGPREPGFVYFGVQEYFGGGLRFVKAFVALGGPLFGGPFKGILFYLGYKQGCPCFGKCPLGEVSGSGLHSAQNARPVRHRTQRGVVCVWKTVMPGPQSPNEESFSRSTTLNIF